MSNSAQKSYLETEILTATPQKLQLLLIEAAIRFSERARNSWQEGDDARATENLLRAQEVVTEMVGNLKPDVTPELVKKYASVNLFVFRQLLAANVEHSEEKLDQAVRVLETERDTWRQVCEQLGDSSNATSPADKSSTSPILDLAVDANLPDQVSPGLSLEA